MIISASYRTDIPAFYGDWFRRRLDDGVVRVPNPYNAAQVSTIPLTPDAVDGFVFWTRNVIPFLPVLDEVAARGFPFLVHHTILGYPRAIDRAVVAPEKAVDALHAVHARFGPRAAVWRYDPVLFTSLTPPAWHAETFDRLAGALAGATDECVVSIAQVYRKTARNMDRAAAAHGFTWHDPDDAEKRAVLEGLAARARGHGLALSLCGQPHLRDLAPSAAGVGEAACVDAARLSDVAGRPLRALARPHRKTCACAASRDIGGYDTCPHGCAYCYAVRSPDAARARHKAHDPAADRL
ncbi:DNA repair photolyase [Caenispirillum salinarum AK4]|uniref:DNA repair photolyase n=1 Tax=Caenispirillum salinarum AK4 TaxID=1238182 RepID=K9HPL4_9PROT|nr:DUF1848 domain-containing protein [Caenispirillum salinarum]EKV32203.1 DNA repair photolyase [Caenispirillum salinarum AK4]